MMTFDQLKSIQKKEQERLENARKIRIREMSDLVEDIRNHFTRDGVEVSQNQTQVTLRSNGKILKIDHLSETEFRITTSGSDKNLHTERNVLEEIINFVDTSLSGEN